MPANIERARILMKKAGIDFLLASTLENCYYLSGIWNLGQELFPHDDQFYVLAPAENIASGVVAIGVGSADLALDAYESIQDVVTYGRFRRALPAGATLNADETFVKSISIDRSPAPSAWEALLQAFTRLNCSHGVVGVDERGPDRELSVRLADQFPHLTFVSASALFRQIRMVKTDAELDLMIAALRANEAGIRAACQTAATGVTERELQLAFQHGVLDAGGFPGFCLLRFGLGTALGQKPAGQTELRSGDYIFFDVGATFKGYRSDIGRIIAYGEPTPKLQRLQDASRAGQSHAVEMMRPGVTANDVFESTVTKIQQSGIPHYERHHVGHGIGIEWYDAPIISPGVDTPLEVGMVFEVETPYYELGFGGAFIEDTVVIREDGAKILTELDRQLTVLPVR